MTTIKKTIAGFVGFAIALSLVAVSPAQAAMTSAELASQIAALQAQLAALSGGTTTTTTSSSSYSFTRDLTIGSTGADVTALQSWLISKGFSIPAGATGYFGTQTQAAVSAYQAARGISPTAGYFGPTTRGRVASEGGSTTTTTTDGGTTTTTTTTSDLEGTDGSIDAIDQLSQYSNEEVGEGEEEVKVLGFEVEASNDGDVALRSIKLRFDQTGNGATDSDRLDDYISGVKVWLGDEEIGSADAEDFNEESNDTYTKTITLKNAVVKSDETEKFYVTVDAVNSFDSSDIDSDSWTIAIDSVRFEDGSGVVTTETTAIDTSMDWDSTGDGVEIQFVSFSTASNTELKLSKSSDSPTSQVVNIDDTDNTDDVSLLKGKLKLEGTSDVLLDELPVTFTAVADGGNLTSVTGSVTLIVDGEKYTETVSTTSASLTGTGLVGTIVFDNLNIDLTADETVEFEVLADINDIESGTFDEGDTLKAEITTTNRGNIDAENEEGDQLADSTEKSGTALGNAQEFRTSGLQVAFVSESTSITSGNSSNDDLGTFKIRFKVQAEGDAVYVSSLVGTSGSTKTVFAVDKSGTATTGNSIAGTLTMVNTSSSSDDDLTAAGNYTIEEGQERTFELVVTTQIGAGGTGGQYRTVLSSIPWNITDSGSTYSTYNSNLDSFKTSYLGLN